jgi:hypothetical protein
MEDVMPYSNISATLSDADRDKILADLKDAWNLLPFLINLTNDEKKALPKMGEKSVSFVEKSLDYAQANPKLVPPYLDPAELQKDVGLVKQLNPIYELLNQLYDALDGTYTAVGSEAYVESLSFYNTVRDASKRNVPGAGAIYDDLQARFPGHPKGNSTTANQAKPAK